MNIKKILLGIVFISTALNARTPEEKNLLFDGETIFWAMIVAGIGGYVCGQYHLHKKYKKRCEGIFESYKKLLESETKWWCRAHGIPVTPEEKQKENDLLFKRNFQGKVFMYFVNEKFPQLDSDGIPMPLQDELPRFKKIMSEEAFAQYSNHIKKSLTDAGYRLDKILVRN